jgi:hypothetical protein
LKIRLKLISVGGSIRGGQLRLKPRLVAIHRLTPRTLVPPR